MWPNVISVSAIDEEENIAEFSAKGKIDFCAPGVDILSTYLGGKYASLSGTSMAAPHLSGVIALMISNKKNDTDGDGKVSAKEVNALLSDYTKDIGTDGYDVLYGNGVLKAR